MKTAIIYLPENEVQCTWLKNISTFLKSVDCNVSTLTITDFNKAPIEILPTLANYDVGIWVNGSIPTVNITNHPSSVVECDNTYYPKHREIIWIVSAVTNWYAGKIITKASKFLKSIRGTTRITIAVQDGIKLPSVFRQYSVIPYFPIWPDSTPNTPIARRKYDFIYGANLKRFLGVINTFGKKMECYSEITSFVLSKCSDSEYALDSREIISKIMAEIPQNLVFEYMEYARSLVLFSTRLKIIKRLDSYNSLIFTDVRLEGNVNSRAHFVNPSSFSEFAQMHSQAKFSINHLSAGMDIEINEKIIVSMFAGTIPIVPRNCGDKRYLKPGVNCLEGSLVKNEIYESACSIISTPSLTSMSLECIIFARQYFDFNKEVRRIFSSIIS